MYVFPFQCFVQLCSHCLLSGPHCSAETSNHDVVSSVDAYRCAAKDAKHLMQSRGARHQNGANDDDHVRQIWEGITERGRALIAFMWKER